MWAATIHHSKALRENMQKNDMFKAFTGDLSGRCYMIAAWSYMLVSIRSGLFTKIQAPVVHLRNTEQVTVITCSSILLHKQTAFLQLYLYLYPPPPHLPHLTRPLTGAAEDAFTPFVKLLETAAAAPPTPPPPMPAPFFTEASGPPQAVCKAISKRIIQSWFYKVR